MYIFIETKQFKSIHNYCYFIKFCIPTYSVNQFFSYYFKKVVGKVLQFFHLSYSF